MPDGNENPATTPAPESTVAAPAQQPAPLSFTPEQLAWIEGEKAKERNAAAAATRRALEGKQKPKAEAPKSEPTAHADATAGTQPVDDFDQQFTARLALESLVQGIASLGLNVTQANAIKTLYKDEKPDDVATWVKQKADGLGFTKTQNPNPAQSPQSSGATPAQSQPVTPSPAPAGSTSPTAPPSDVLRWSKDMVDAEMRQKAVVPHDLYDRRNRAVWRAAKDKALAAMAGVRVVATDEQLRK